MKNRNFGDFFKNAMGTVFLLAGAFFVCSTLLSMRAVFADPIAPVVTSVATAASPRANATASRATGRTTATTSRATGTSRARTTATTAAAPATNATASRAAAGAATSRAVTNRATTTSRPTAATTSANTTSRGVTARTTATSRAGGTRNVVSRTATTPTNTARVSLSGSAIRGSTSTNTNTYTYLSGKLYTGNYSNIIDSTTGLISAEAYSNCMDSYYACMDEICTARNSAQRRCACAGRVKSFAAAEQSLTAANEELIKISGELTLLEATKGKDISSAFQLTDAEKILNCVSWREASQNGTSETNFGDWCAEHGLFANCAFNKKPDYCTGSSTGNSFSFDVDLLDGMGSDILASVTSWMDAKDKTLTITESDDSNLTTAFDKVSSVVNGLSGLDSSLTDTANVKDSLAETWGYELFEYAHNNVCARVLDSCFNGIYEACGAPPSSQKCTNGAAQCPYNYNSKISVTNSGTYELNFVTPNNGYTNTTNSASCFGYSSTSVDPYVNLRGSVADARRSILQKYALDANADCDAYGEQLRDTAQDIGYKKVAAQQLLQKLRLKYTTEEAETTLADAISAGTNFNQCISELYDCYEQQAKNNTSWPDARIKTYCAQVTMSPSCYQTMICNPSTSSFKAVIDVQDDTACNNSQDYKENTCRNVVTLNEIVNGINNVEPTICDAGKTCNSAAMRQQCLLDAIGRDATTPTKNAVQAWTTKNTKPAAE